MVSNRVTGRAARRRTMLATAFALALTTGLSGGAVAQNDMELSGEFTVLTFGGPLLDAAQAAVDQFEELHPGVSGTVNPITNEDWRRAAALVLSADDAPDVAFVQVDARMYPTLIENDILTPINDLWDELGLEDVYSQAQIDVYTAADGNRYAVNQDVVWAPVVYYNKDAFAEAGIDFDGGRVESLEQWYDIAEKLDAAGYIPLAIGGGEVFPLNHLTDQLFQTAYSEADFSEYLTNWRAGTESDATYTDAGFVSVLETLKDWNDRGILAEGTAALKNEQADQLFLTQRAAMVQSGSWGAGIYRNQEPDFEIGWLLYPGLGETGTSFLAYAGNGYSIPVKAQNPEVAREFLKFLMSEEHQTSNLPGPGLIPARTDIDPAVLEGVDDQVKEQMAAFGDYGTSTLWGDTVPPDLGEFIDPLLQGILIGTETPEGAAEKLQAELEKLQEG